MDQCDCGHDLTQALYNHLLDGGWAQEYEARIECPGCSKALVFTYESVPYFTRQPEQDWVFTFRDHHVDRKTGEPLAGCYAVINGTYDSARDQACSRFGGNQSAWQHASREEAGVETNGLREVTL